MRMSVAWMVLVLLPAAVAMASAAQTAAVGLPLTIDERISACIDAEDADPPHSVALADSVLAGPAALSPLQRAEAHGCRGWAQATLSRLDEARRDAHALAGIVRSLPESAERVRLTRRAGGILHRSGDRIAATDLYALAVAEAEALGLEAERIPLLANLGVLHSEFEEHERARVNYEQALALMDRLGDHRHEAPVRYNLGLNLLGQQRNADAVPHLRRALDLVRDTGLGGPMQQVAIGVALASALSGSGDIDGARTLIAEVQGLGAPLHDSSLRAQMTLIDAAERAAQGAPAAALALLDPLPMDSLSEIQQWQVLVKRAELQERLGRFADATVTLRAINALRERYLRHQNHERLAALEAHLRDREQRVEIDRLQADAQSQALRLAAQARLQWVIVGGAGLLLLLGGSVMLWQRRMNHRLDRASRTDALTGLPNRRDMVQRLRALSVDTRVHAAVLLVDIDLFKRINDQHGHAVGDQVLIAFGQRLMAGAGSAAALARWGGEEFLLLLPHADHAAVRALAERLRVELARPIRTDAGAIELHASIGYANLPLPGAGDPEAWQYSVQLADSALYLAKQSGRDAWAGYWLDRPIDEWPAERIARDIRLARALGLVTPTASRALKESPSVVVLETTA